MEVGNRQQLRAAGLEPPGTRLGLTRRTVSIPARVKGETRGATVVTRLPTPAQPGGAARRDRAQSAGLHLREPMCAAIRVAVGTHEVREGETDRRDRGRRPGGDGTHGLGPWRVESIEQIEGRARPDLRVPRQLQVPRRGAEMAVPH